MINAVQIRSARALLDWSTSELARRAGITVNAINRIERGHVNAQRRTIEKIEEVFTASGIEFLPGSGLRKKDKRILIYEGNDFRRKLAEDILNSLKKRGSELLVAHGGEQSGFGRIGVDFIKRHFTERKKARVTYRSFIRSDAKALPLPPPAYHVMPRDYFSSYPLYICGDKLALSTLESSPKTIIIDSAPVAESIRKIFDYIWNNTLDASTYRDLKKKSGKTTTLTNKSRK